MSSASSVSMSFGDNIGGGATWSSDGQYGAKGGAVRTVGDGRGAVADDDGPVRSLDSNEPNF